MALSERSAGAVGSGTFPEVPGFHREAYCGSHGDRDNLYDSRLGGAARIGAPVTGMEGMASIAAQEILLYRKRQGYIGVTYKIHLTGPLSL